MLCLMNLLGNAIKNNFFLIYNIIFELDHFTIYIDH